MSISILGITNVCPSRNGKASNMAMQDAFSEIL
jgi:hypothetical protein